MSIVLLYFGILALGEQPWIRATVMMDQPNRHFYQLEMTFPPRKGEIRSIKMATWTPGSYKIRDFSKNVESFAAFDLQGNPLQWTKSDKSTWDIKTPVDAGFKVRYQVFAYTFSVRTSFLSDVHGFINPASVFFYEAGHLSTGYTVLVKPPEGWSVASCLEKLDEAHFKAKNFDELVDSPFQFGKFRRHEYQVRHIPHYWLIAGDVNLNEVEMINALKAIGETVGDLFGDFPFKNYYIFSQFRLDGAGGGLEHHNATMVQGHSSKLRTKKGWYRFLGLMIHEYFHAWNVKTIRDESLGPFDYQNENYTDLLWLHEGWTSYYDTLLMGRAGFLNDKKLLKAFSKQIVGYIERPATSRQSLREASFNAWIHQYQPSATRNNSQTSYYKDGAVSGLALDLLIRHSSKGEKSLDDVMRILYNDYGKQNRPINWEIVGKVLGAVAGPNSAAFLDTYVAHAEPLPLALLLDYAGLEMVWSAALDEDDEDDVGKSVQENSPYAPNPKVSLGIKVLSKKGASYISDVIRDRTGWQAGLDFGDEILAINDRRVSANNFDEILGWSRPGDEVTVLLNRAGKVLTVSVKLEEHNRKLELKLREDASTLEKKIYKDMFGTLTMADQKVAPTRAE